MLVIVARSVYVRAKRKWVHIYMHQKEVLAYANWRHVMYLNGLLRWRFDRLSDTVGVD